MIGHWKAMSDFLVEMGYHPKQGPISDETRISLGRQYTTALFMEAAELMESFDWKPWRKEYTIDHENIKREIVDCLVFLHHIAITFGITAADLETKFIEVDTNNRRRYVEGDFSGEDTKEPSILDIMNEMKKLSDQILTLQEDK